MHGASTPAANHLLVQLFSQLNETQTHYPGTDMCLLYELGVSGVQKATEVSP